MQCDELRMVGRERKGGGRHDRCVSKPKAVRGETVDLCFVHFVMTSYLL
jgi:hypothetical protein